MTTTIDTTKFVLRKSRRKNTFLGARRYNRNTGTYCEDVGLDKARIFNSTVAAKLANRYRGYTIVPVTVSV